jgi:hypothetical protein
MMQAVFFHSADCVALIVASFFQSWCRLAS